MTDTIYSVADASGNYIKLTRIDAATGPLAHRLTCVAQGEEKYSRFLGASEVAGLLQRLEGKHGRQTMNSADVLAALDPELGPMIRRYIGEGVYVSRLNLSADDETGSVSREWLGTLIPSAALPCNGKQALAHAK